MFLPMCLLVQLMVLTWQLTVVSPRTFGLCCYDEGDVYDVVSAGPLMVLINGLSRSVCLFHGGCHRGDWFARLRFGGQMVVAMRGLLGNFKAAAVGGLHGYHWFCRYI